MMNLRSDPTFANVANAVSSLPPPYHDTLAVRVDVFDTLERPPVDLAIGAYVDWLELMPAAPNVLRRISVPDARRLCEICCTFDIAYEQPRIKPEPALAVVDAWMLMWTADCAFFSNIPPGSNLSSPEVLRLAGTPALFRDDVSVGVVAVECRRIGLFFYHSNS